MSDPAGAAADRTAAVDEVDRQLAGLVKRIRSRWRSLARQVHPEVQPIGYLVLASLASGGPATASQLVATLGTDKSTLSRQISHLEELGLVERQVDANDRRVHLLALAPQTAQRLAEVRAQSLAELRSELGSWPLQDVVTLGALLGRLAGAVDAPNPPAGDGTPS